MVRFISGCRSTLLVKFEVHPLHSIVQPELIDWHKKWLLSHCLCHWLQAQVFLFAVIRAGLM